MIFGKVRCGFFQEPLAVLVAVLSHQAWPPVLVSIVGTLPTLYVAWLAVPGVISSPEPAKKLAYGRPVLQSGFVI